MEPKGLSICAETVIIMRDVVREHTEQRWLAVCTQSGISGVSVITWLLLPMFSMDQMCVCVCIEKQY